MRELLAELTKILEEGRPCVYCSVVETRGSTPQKAGAAMLVFPDGRQVGTLGGGCVEAEVKRQALGTLSNESDAKAEVLTFCLDDDYGWDDGLICGGRMSILADPLSAGPVQADYYRRFRALADEGRGCLEAVVLGAASGLPVGSRYLFDAAGRLAAQLAGEGDVPEVILRGLPALAARPRPATQHGIAY